MAYDMPVYVREERLSANGYLRLMQENPKSVRDVYFVSPNLGRNDDFGHFLVKYHELQKRTYKMQVPSFEDDEARCA